MLCSGGLAGLVLAKSVLIGLVSAKLVLNGVLRSRSGVTCANEGDSLSGVACESEFGPFEAFTLRFRLPGILPGLGCIDGKSRVEPKLLTDRWPSFINSDIRGFGNRTEGLESRSSARLDNRLCFLTALCPMRSSP